MRVLLFPGLAFETLANRLERQLVLRADSILYWLASRCIALAQRLRHLIGYDERRGGEVGAQ
jgi:hypothetical protein